MKRDIGIHFRIEKSYAKLLEQAKDLGASTCQFFFMPQDSNKYLRLTSKDKATFLELRRKYFSRIFGHSSYWINLATGRKESAKVSLMMLKKEIKIAQKLEIDFLVVHAGSAKGFDQTPDDPNNKQKGLQAVAKILNKALKHEDKITVLIENTTHGKTTICSDFNDFKLLKNYLEKPEQVKFCLDTAHAFSYGYDLQNTEDFIKSLDQTIGTENIKLIHLNDSAKPCGSKIDQHDIPGDGLIGKKVLQKLINHEKLKNIPIIIEPPLISWEETKKIIDEIKNW